jgi:hypothetical protein
LQVGEHKLRAALGAHRSTRGPMMVILTPTEALMRHTLTAIAAMLALSSLVLLSLGLATTASAQDDESDDDVICSYDAYNCGDFSSCSQVMRVFRACEADVHRLDRDKDGVPCESLCD